MNHTAIHQISIMPATSGGGFDTFLCRRDRPMEVENSGTYASKDSVMQAVSKWLDDVRFEG